MRPGRDWSRRRKHGASARLCALLLVAISCDDQTSSAPSGGDSPSTGAGSEESPNARILPEPLVEDVGKDDDDSPLSSDGKAEPAPPREREKPRPFPVSASLDDDDLRRGIGTGFEMELQIAWPEAKKTVRIGQEEVNTWPTLQVQLLREGPDQAARLRLVLHSPTFPLPNRSEIRARADRLGYLVVWPDQRSYRVVPPGALRAVFADRRVDRTPFVEPQSVSEKQGNRLGKDTSIRTLKTPIGKVVLESVDVKELPYAGPLLCSTLLELARVRGTPSVCGMGQLPVHFEINWANGETFVLSVLSWGAVSDLLLDHFRTPPDLPIFKRGELPPFGDFFFDQQALSSMLPLTKEKAAPVPPSPAPPAEGALGKPSPVAGDEKASPPRNEVKLTNTLGQPLVVMMNRTPFLWLGPGASVPLYSSANEVRLSARGFLGEVKFEEKAYTAPVEVKWGAPPAPDPIVPTP